MEKRGAWSEYGQLRAQVTEVRETHAQFSWMATDWGQAGPGFDQWLSRWLLQAPRRFCTIDRITASSAFVCLHFFFWRERERKRDEKQWQDGVGERKYVCVL